MLDCSVVGAWFFADEADPYADAVARRRGLPLATLETTGVAIYGAH